MSSHDKPGIPPVPPRPTAARPAAAGAAPPRPAAAPPARPGAPARPGVPARPPTGGKGEWTPEMKGGAPPARKPPDDLLEMKKVSSDTDTEEPPQGATQFFSLPNPKKKAPKRDEEESMVPTRAAPQPPPPMQAPPPMQHPGMQQHPGMMPPPGYPVIMGIQGPVAGGPNGPQGYGQRPPEPPPELERAQSFRVFAILVGLFTILGAVLLACVVVVVGVVWWGDQDKDRGAPEIEVTRPIADRGDAEEEEEEVEEPPPPPPPPQPQPRKSAGSGPAPEPRPPKPPAPPPPSATGAVTIILPAGSPWTSVEISCPDVAGYERPRVSFSGGTATIPNVPSGTGCQANFKGGPPAKTPVRAGTTYNCSPGPTGVVCR